MTSGSFSGILSKFLIPIPKILKIDRNSRFLKKRFEYQAQIFENWSQSRNFEISIPIPKFWKIDLNSNPKNLGRGSQCRPLITTTAFVEIFYKFILISTFLLWLASVLREVLWRSGGPGVKSSGLGSFEQFIGQYLFLHLEYKRLAKCIWAGSKFFKQNSK